MSHCLLVSCPLHNRRAESFASGFNIQYSAVKTRLNSVVDADGHSFVDASMYNNVDASSQSSHSFVDASMHNNVDACSLSSHSVADASTGSPDFVNSDTVSW